MKLTSNVKQVCAQSVNKNNNAETQDEKNHFGAAKPKISTIQKTRLDTK